MLRGFRFLWHIKTKFQLLYVCCQGLNVSMATIFTSPGVAVTPEISVAAKKAEVVLVWQVLLTPQRCRIVIVCFSGCGRHRN